MKRLLTLVGIVPLLFAVGPLARAQEMKEPGGKELARGTAELRVGALWRRANARPELEFTHFSIGGRVAPYLGRGRFLHRFSIPIAFDYSPVSRTTYFEPILNSKARISEHLIILNPALGFDVVQTAQVDVTLRYGGAAFANLTRFELPSRFGGWEDVCDISPFSGACYTNWNYLGNAGAGIRIFPWKHRGFYFGVDFTRYAGSKNQVMGTFGGTF